MTFFLLSFDDDGNGIIDSCTMIKIIENPMTELCWKFFLPLQIYHLFINDDDNFFFVNDLDVCVCVCVNQEKNSMNKMTNELEMVWYGNDVYENRNFSKRAKKNSFH